MNYSILKQKPKANYGFIYKYTSPSNKSYIGQTIYSPEYRARKDGEGYKNCSIFYSAIKKYGYENFEFEILEEVEYALLDEKEKYYIEFYNTLKPNGYNCYPGGSVVKTTSSRSRTEIDVYDSELNYIKSFSSELSAAYEYNIPYQAISACVNHAIAHYKGMVYVRHGEKPKSPVVHHTNGRKTGQFDEEDNLIAIFPSANAAARAIGKNSTAGRNIRCVCEGQRQHAYGYKWKFLD